MVMKKASYLFKEELKDVYNQFDNADGSKLKVINHKLKKELV